MPKQSHYQHTDLRRIEDVYNAGAPTWDQYQARGERWAVGETFQREMVQAVRGTVLEIGCGTGAMLRQIQASPGDVSAYTGVDLSTGMLQQAQALAKDSPFPITFHHMNAESLALFADDSFDTVMAHLVLCTVPNPESALREMSRVCKPEGKIVLIEHVLGSSKPVQWVQKLAAPAQRKRWCCSIDRRTNDLVREMGFPVEKDASRLFGVVHLMVLRPMGEHQGG